MESEIVRKFLDYGIGGVLLLYFMRKDNKQLDALTKELEFAQKQQLEQNAELKKIRKEIEELKKRGI